MRGLIRYTPQVETPQQAFMDRVFPLHVAYPLRDTVEVGAETDIYLPKYLKLDHMPRKTNDSKSKSTSGVRQSLFYSSERGKKIALDWVKEDREGNNQIAIYNALNDAVERGVWVKWFPDFDNYPDEFHTCTVERIQEPRRDQNLSMMWWCAFDFIFIEDVQSISTVPIFV